MTKPHTRRLQVFKEGNAPQDPVYLRLIQSTSGSVMLRVVTEDGRHALCGLLLQFKPDGTVLKFPSVAKEYGFDLDASGYLNIEREI